MKGLGADKRLQALADDLASGRYRVLSLDVFDTLLWRRVPEPRDLFFQIGNELRSQNLLLSWVSVAQFAELRAAAEKAARAQAEARTGSREVLLADIYAALPDHIWRDAKASTVAVGIEAATESAAMVLDHDVAELLDVAKKNDVRAVLTSDTYFTRDELMGFLTQAGLAAERIPETLYISNEHGRPKWRDLFDDVLTDLGVSPNEVVHVGDNVDADVNPCVMRGMAHIFYDKWSALPRTLKKELSGQPSQRANWILSGGDYGLTGLRSRLVQRPPATIDKGHEPYWVYGATTLAPLFAAYASWVVRTAAQENGAPIFGIMREGRFLSRLVEAVAKAMGHDVEPGELWLSRRAVVRAALWSDDLTLLSQAVSYCPGPSSDDVLEQLGLSRSDLAGVFQDTSLFDIHAPGGVEAFLTGVSRSSDLQDKIVKYSERRRGALITYLESALNNGMDGRAILLDLGYAGTIQTVLQKILQRENKALSLTGMYIAVNPKGRDNVRAGVDLRALIGDEGFESALTRLLERTPDILEHACMCPDGSLDMFSDAGAPEFLPSQRPASQIAQMESMQDGILAGATAIVETLGEDCLSSPAFLDHASEIVKQAMLCPTAEEIDTVGSWLHEANFDLADQRALADLRIDPATLEFGGPQAWSNLARHEAYWPQAALSKLNATLANAAAAISDGCVEPEVFSSGSVLGSLSIVSDFGVGFEDRRAMFAPLDVSVLGRGEIQVQIKGFSPQAYQAIQLHWPGSGSVLSVGQCAVIYRGEAEQSVIDVTSDLVFGESVHHQSGFMITGPDGAMATLDLKPSMPAWPHTLDLLLRFKFIRLEQIF